MLVTTLKGQATDIISYLTVKKFLTIMSSVSGRPPPLSRETISRITCKYFNFTKVHGDSIKSFPSYSDRNYYFQGKCMNAASLEFVLKLNNPLYTTFEEMKGICSVMEHLTSRGFSTQHPLTSREGSHIIKLTYAELSGTLEDNKGIETRDSTTDTCGANKREPGFKYFVSVLSYIPGQLFDKVEKRYLTPKLLYEIGELLGRIDQELMENFSNKALELRYLEWDLMNFPDIRSQLQCIDNLGQRNKVERVYKAFQENVVPRISSFKKGIIHGDPNGLNIVLKESVLSKDVYDLGGFIDFGDCVKTCTIFDLGICIAYAMMENLKPVICSSAVEFVGPLIRGYNSILPLSKEEFDSLYYLVLARCCHSAINGALQFKAEPWNDYLLTSPKKAWKVIDELLDTPKEQVDRVWKSELQLAIVFNYEEA